MCVFVANMTHQAPACGHPSKSWDPHIYYFKCRTNPHSSKDVELVDPCQSGAACDLCDAFSDEQRQDLVVRKPCSSRGDYRSSGYTSLKILLKYFKLA